jgi:hypothetical protein
MKRVVFTLVSLTFFVSTVAFLFFLEQFTISPPDWAVASMASGFKQIYKAFEFGGLVIFVLLFVGFCGFLLRAILGE